VSDNVHAWPKPAGRADAPLPKPIIRPCDWGLKGAINNLETQLGTIEAYNRLATAAAALKAKIDAGKAEAQNPMYAVSTGARED
jgi:hypothetical protein